MGLQGAGKRVCRSEGERGTPKVKRVVREGIAIMCERGDREQGGNFVKDPGDRDREGLETVPGPVTKRGL